MMRRWLARLGFPFLVLAFVLAWEGRRASAGRGGSVDPDRVTLYYAGAAVLGAAGLAGVRERHRRSDP